MQDDEFEFHEVDRGRWDDPEGLFNSRGGPKYCWCMVWRTMPAGVSCGDNDAKKEALRGQVQQGEAIGILGYINGEVVAWCSNAPRDSYRPWAVRRTRWGNAFGPSSAFSFREGSV